MGKIKKNCQWCDLEFESYDCDKRKFCSKRCFYEYKKTLKGKKNKKYSQVIKNCEWCNKEFSSLPSTKRKFCSNECRYKSWKTNYAGKVSSKGGKKPIVCQRCGIVFYVYPYREKSAKYCSRECSKNQVVVSCAWCKKLFSMKRVSAEEHKIHFCTSQCRIDYGSVLITCQYCDMEFRARRSLVEKGLVKYCSKNCHSLWMSENLRGDKRYNWVGGTKQYPQEFNARFKTIIRARDLYTCQICYKKKAKSVHHINYEKQDTVKSNCITLCVSCHTKTNTNRERWMMLLQMLQMQRGIFREKKD